MKIVLYAENENKYKKDVIIMSENKYVEGWFMKSKKIKALQIMGKHVVDPQNAVIITNKLSFSDSKDKALRMLPR